MEWIPSLLVRTAILCSSSKHVSSFFILLPHLYPYPTLIQLQYPYLTILKLLTCFLIFYICLQHARVNLCICDFNWYNGCISQSLFSYHFFFLHIFRIYSLHISYLFLFNKLSQKILIRLKQCTCIIPAFLRTMNIGMFSMDTDLQLFS